MKSQLKIGIILGYINMGIGNLIPLFYTPVMLALLGQAEYGLYKLSSSAIGYLSLLSLGIGSALTRYLIKAKIEDGQSGEEKVLGLFVILFRWITVICVIVGILLTLNLDIWYNESLTEAELLRMKIISAIMVANTALTFMMTPYVSLVTTHERFLFMQCMNIVSTTIVPIINIIVLYLGYASIGMAISSLIICFIIRCIYYLYIKLELKIVARINEAPYHLMKDIFNFSIWIFIGDVIDMLYNATDILIIGMLPAFATVGVAIYSIGTIFNSIVFSLATGVSSLIAPRINKMVLSGASNTEVTDVTIKVGRIQGFIFALFCTGFICFGLPFIHYYVGDEYKESYYIALLMMIPHGIPLVQSACLDVVIAKNQHRFRAIVYMFIAIANVIGTWLLLPLIGLKGAALMTGIALIVGQGFIMNWYYWMKSGIQIIRFWMNVGIMYLIPLLLCAGTLIVSKYIDFYKISTLFIGITTYTIIYLLLQFKFILNEFEQNLVLDLFKKIAHHNH